MKIMTTTILLFLLVIFQYGCDVTFLFHYEGATPSTAEFEKNTTVAVLIGILIVFTWIPARWKRKFDVWLGKKIRKKAQAVKSKAQAVKTSLKKKPTLEERIERESRKDEVIQD